MIVRLILVFSVCVLFSCKQEKYIDSSELMDASIFHASVKNLTDVMIHDIFSPPQAGRNYAYPAIAAYEVIRFADPENYKSLVGRVRDLKALPQAPENISFVIAAFEAYNQVAKALIFSEKNFLEFVDATYASEILDSIPNHVSRNSRAYGNSVAKHILDWLAEDNYNQTRSFPKFDVTDEPGKNCTRGRKRDCSILGLQSVCHEYSWSLYACHKENYTWWTLDGYYWNCM